MSVSFHFDTGSLSHEEATGVVAFLAAVTPSLLPANALREYNKGLYNSVSAPALTPKEAVNADALNVLIPAATPETSGRGEVGIQTTAPARERGKPAPGQSRRTKKEIAEDEAAEKAEASTQQAISTGGERVGPEDTTEDAEQDAADEAAEAAASAEPEKPLTEDDVRNAMMGYVNAYGMEAAQADGPLLLKDTLGAPPEGQSFWKLTLIPVEKYGAVVKAWTDAAAAGKRYVGKGA